MKNGNSSSNCGLNLKKLAFSVNDFVFYLNRNGIGFKPTMMYKLGALPSKQRIEDATLSRFSLVRFCFKLKFEKKILCGIYSPLKKTIV